MKVRILAFLLIISFPVSLLSKEKEEIGQLIRQASDENDSVRISANIKLAEIFTEDNYSLAEKYALTALEVSLTKERKKDEADACNALGLIYIQAKKYDKALEKFYNCLKIRKEIKEMAGVADCYNNLGLVFRSTGEVEKSLEHFLKAAEVAKTNNYQKNIGAYFDNAGKSYYMNSEYELAYDFFMKSLVISESNNDIKSTATVLTDLGMLFIKQDEKEKAMEYLEKAYMLAKTNRLLPETRRAAEVLNSLFILSDDYKSAYFYYKEFTRLTDSIKSIKLANRMSFIETEIKFEKEQQLELVSVEKEELESTLILERQLFILALFVLAAVSVIIILMLLFKGFRRKRTNRKIINEQKVSIEEKSGVLYLQSDEIGMLKNEIDRNQNLITQQQNENLKIKNQIIESAEYASRISSALITGKEEFRRILPDSFIMNMPCEHGSGDFYFISKKADRIIIAVGDCTGRGVAGTLMSVLGMNLFSIVVNEKGIARPNVILNTVRDLFNQSVGDKSNDHMEAAVISISHKTKTIEYAGAKSPAYIVRKDHHGAEELQPDRMRIGDTDMMQPFTNKSVSISEGDSLYLFTDGFTAQFGGKSGKKFNNNMFRQLLIWSSPRSVYDQEAAIAGAFHEWKGENEQVDDVLVVGVKF